MQVHNIRTLHFLGWGVLWFLKFIRIIISDVCKQVIVLTKPWHRE